MIAINIEMPKSCEECPIPYITDDMELQCPFQKLYVTGLDKRAVGCPLEELKGERRTMENKKIIEELEEIKFEVVNIPMDIHKKDILNILERHILKFKWGETKV